MEITREALKNGTFRFRVDGEIHTKGSKKCFTHASVYERVALSEYDIESGRKVGDKIVFLHQRLDLAVTGAPDANRIAAHGAWKRIGGAFEIIGGAVEMEAS